ncbi:hypothetical protein DESC_580099 [Desulfosarcina cetonica]|nr:hypothetical protein DESC_580099 [Desulfosarcina cetonica]
MVGGVGQVIARGFVFRIGEGVAGREGKAFGGVKLRRELHTLDRGLIHVFINVKGSALVGLTGGIRDHHVTYFVAIKGKVDHPLVVQKPLLDTRRVADGLFRLQVRVGRDPERGVPIGHIVIQLADGRGFEGLAHRGAQGGVFQQMIHHVQFGIEGIAEGGVMVPTEAGNQHQFVEQGPLILQVYAEGIHVLFNGGPGSHGHAVDGRGVVHVVVDGLTLKFTSQGEYMADPRIPGILELALVKTDFAIPAGGGKLVTVVVALEHELLVFREIEIQAGGDTVAVFRGDIGRRSFKFADLPFDPGAYHITENNVEFTHGGVAVIVIGIIAGTFGVLMVIIEQKPHAVVDFVAGIGIGVAGVAVFPIIRRGNLRIGIIVDALRDLVPAVFHAGAHGGFLGNLAGDDVDHAGHGVTAVQHRGGPLDHFDPLDHGNGNLVQSHGVLPVRAALAAAMHPLTVDEDQAIAVVETKTPQPGTGRGAPENVVVARHGHAGNGFNDVGYGLGIALLDILTGNQGGLHRCILDRMGGTRAGHHDFVELGDRFGLFGPPPTGYQDE